MPRPLPAITLPLFVFHRGLFCVAVPSLCCAAVCRWCAFDVQAKLERAEEQVERLSKATATGFPPEALDQIKALQEQLEKHLEAVKNPPAPAPAPAPREDETAAVSPSFG